MQPCTACSDACSPSSGGAGSLLPLLCGALFVFLVLIRASLNAAWAPPAPWLVRPQTRRVCCSSLGSQCSGDQQSAELGLSGGTRLPWLL